MSTPSKKNGCSFPSNCQLPAALHKEWDLEKTSSVLTFCLAWPHVDLGKVTRAAVDLYLRLPYCIRKHCTALHSIPSHLAFPVFLPPLLQCSPKHWHGLWQGGEQLIKISYWRLSPWSLLSASVIYLSLHWWLWLEKKRSFSGKSWVKRRSMYIKNKYLQVNFTAWPLSKITVAGSTLWTLTTTDRLFDNPAMDFWSWL